MKNSKLNRTVISILGVLFVPALLANAGVSANGFGQDADASKADSAKRAGTQDAPKKDEVIDEFGTFEIAVEDVPLPQVLNMLAIQSRRNIITSKRVGSVSITANLFDVTFYEALDSILHIASLCYEEQGNFIYVMTCDEKLQRAQANRVLEDRVFYLDHISPADAESLAKPLLSTKGSMSKLGVVERGFQPGATEAGGDDWAHEPVLVVRDYAENLESIEALLKDVDTPPKQVVVESTILVTKANGDYAWGMDVSVLLKANFSQLLNPLNPVSWLQNLQQQPQAGTGTTKEGTTPTDNAIALQSTVGQSTEAGGFKFGILNENIGVFLRLLDEVSDTTILARPKILALNRQRAQVLVGERVAYLSTTQTETAATQTVQYLETGINLILRPFISRDGSIRMELYPSVSEARLRPIGDASGIGFTTVPDEFTNEITTNVRVRDGETVVLGGLFKDETSISRRSVPGLGDIPIAGNAFKGQDDKVERSEIIFLVTPTIVREEVMMAASEEAEALAGNILVGVREGLLPWARETLASNSSHDAYQALETGDVDLAISHINRSLRNKPDQPELVQMREDLLGEPSVHANDNDVLRGVFDRTFNRNVDENGVVEPVSDPLSSRMNERNSFFGQMKAVPVFADEPMSTDGTTTETTTESMSSEKTVADTDSTTTATDTELEAALASADPGADSSSDSSGFENEFTTDSSFESTVDASDSMTETDMTAETFASADDANFTTDMDSEDAFEMTSAPQESAAVVEEDEPEISTTESTDLNAFTFEEEGTESTPSEFTGAEDFDFERENTESTTTDFTDLETFDFEGQAADMFALTSEGDTSGETFEDFEDVEEEMDEETSAPAEADATGMPMVSNGAKFNLFLDSMFRSRLIDWWIEQSKKSVYQNESLVSFDE